LARTAGVLRSPREEPAITVFCRDKGEAPSSTDLAKGRAPKSTRQERSTPEFATPSSRRCIVNEQADVLQQAKCEIYDEASWRLKVGRGAIG